MWAEDAPHPRGRRRGSGSTRQAGINGERRVSRRQSLRPSGHAAGHLNVTGFPLHSSNSARKLAAPPFLSSSSSPRAQIMPCATELVHGKGGAIKVGTTGTIGSLMTRELDAVKVTPQAAAGIPRLRRQGCPVSVSCGCGATTPRKLMLRKSSSDISSSSSSNRVDRVSAEEASKPRRVSRRSTFDSPMLRSDGALADRTTSASNKAKKKGSMYGVEVVDVKCGNPMSSRLKKLGFSKLSETFA